MFDLVLQGGCVVDGTGRPGVLADVGVRGERIEGMGDLSRAEAHCRLDVTGKVVSPGFVDTHTHAEGALLVDPQLDCAIRQGITTLFIGIDGMSYAPLSPANYRTYRHWLSGLLGFPPEELDMSSVAALRAHYHQRVAVNTVYLAPHATIRLEVLGFRDVPMDDAALRQAEQLLRESLEQGAVGFTSGSKYYPGPWGDTRELIALCRVVAEMDRVYMSEPRSVPGIPGGGGAAEAMAIATASGCKLHFAHWRTSAESAGHIEEIMADIDGARIPTSDVTFDIYPYPSGSSIPISFLPGWAQDGGPDEILRRLESPDERGRIGVYLDAHQDGFLEPMTLSFVPHTPSLEGVRLSALAVERGQSRGEALCDLLLENQLTLGHVTAPPSDPAVCEQIMQDALALLSRPDYMVCSDITPAGGVPHPRCYGAFPRLLAQTRRADSPLSLEATLHRMTDRPARRFGLTDRGRVAVGYFADLVVLDPNTVTDTATYAEPKRFPLGIPHVVVNGQLAVENNHCTGVFAGRAIP